MLRTRSRPLTRSLDQSKEGLAVDATHEAEEWRPVLGYEGQYEVSDHGRVRSLDREIEPYSGRGARSVKGRILKPYRSPRNYFRIGLPIPNSRKQRWIRVHVLVLSAFVGPRPPGMQGCHNDGDYCNNHLANLRWDTPSSNIRDAIRHGTHSESRKTHCKRGHPFDDVNTYIAPRGGRFCRECHRLAHPPKRTAGTQSP